MGLFKKKEKQIKKPKTPEQILKELNKKDLYSDVAPKHMYKQYHLKEFGYDLDGYVIIDDNGKALEIVSPENIDNVSALYEAKSKDNKIKAEEQRLILEEKQKAKTLTRQEKKALEDLKPDSERHLERFNQAKQIYLDSNVAIAEYLEEEYKIDFEEGISDDDIREYIKKDSKLQSLQNRKLSAMKNFFRISRALTAISGENYREQAYDTMTSGTVGSLQKDYGLHKISPENVKHYGQYRMKKQLSEEQPEVVELATHKDLIALGNSGGIDPNKLYRVRATNSYFRQSDEGYSFQDDLSSTGDKFGSFGKLEKVDFDRAAATSIYKPTKELSEDDLIDILVREKSNKK